MINKTYSAVNTSPSGFSKQLQLKLKLERSCYKCSCSINIMQEQFYTIGKEYPLEKRQDIKFFCSGCFDDVAGKEYL